jgi:hypothetical protein
MILICLTTTYCFSSDNYDPNALRLSANNSTVPSGTSEGGIWAKVLYSKFDILFVFILGLVSTLFGFILGLIGTCFIDYLRTRRKAEQFRHAAYSELKQILFEMLIYTIHPDSIIDKEKVQLLLDLMNKFNLNEEACPTGNNEGYEKIKNMSQENIDSFVSAHKSQKVQRQVENKMMTLKKLNCIFISHNIETFPILSIQYTSRLLNILRRIDAINGYVERIDFAFKKTFDGSISTTNHDNIVFDYYSDCQCLSDFAKKTAKEVADFIAKWQK